jgi:hypothetical protein
MAKQATTHHDRPRQAKRPYLAPALKVLGDFRKLTTIKGGSNSDGTGKPRTRFFGSNS